MDRRAELANCLVWADLALEHFGLETGQMPCVWNWRLKRRMGQARCQTNRQTGQRIVTLEFSPEIFERATPEQRNETAAHEAAHGVVWLKHGAIRRGRRHDHHGPVWQATMRALGFEPKRCHDVDTTGLGRRHMALSCNLCGETMGRCTPRKAQKLQAAYQLTFKCCGRVPSEALKVVDTRG